MADWTKTEAGDDVERVAEVLKALGHPVRLRLVHCLAETGERSVGDLCRTLDVAQSVVSQQLSILRLQGVVRVRRDGGFGYYSLAMPQVRDLLSCVMQCGRNPRGG